ncbi:MAG: hypothetical protein GY860_00055 [Desulfobacteraceae bacterium]|nr:hypothetical protein [Desulfobacteraceae bacterium]
MSLQESVNNNGNNGITPVFRILGNRNRCKGYPCGLKGEAIPLGARIIALADSLSAILQNRPYRPARNFDDAMAEIVNCADSQFDPDVVAAFISISEEIRSILKFIDPGQDKVA